MKKQVIAPTSALVVLGMCGLALSPACRGPIEVQKGDFLLHAAPETAPPVKSDPKARPIPSPDPAYHSE
jgi:hypothetical protein